MTRYERWSVSSLVFVLDWHVRNHRRFLPVGSTMKWPWVSRRKHEELMRMEREWTTLSARTHFTFATREAAREGYKVGFAAGLEQGLRKSDSNA